MLERLVVQSSVINDGRWNMAEQHSTIYSQHCGLWCHRSRPPFTSCKWQLAKDLTNHSTMALPFNNIGSE